jgi:hypothetical protein
MGHMNAMGFREAVEEGSIGLDAALEWHLTGNCYPPLPVGLVPFAKAALTHCNNEEWDAELTRPDGALLADQSGTPITARRMVEELRLEAFLGLEEE